MPRIRWWIPALVIGLASAVLVWCWRVPDASRQTRVLRSGGVALLSGVLLLAWTQLPSGFSRRVRLAILVLAFATGGLGFALLEIRGVTGDLVPIVGWRFASRTPVGRDPVQSGADVGTGGASRQSALPYPQFLGPGRDATVRGVVLARDWRARPPREVWRRSVGAGWSGFAVAGGDAVTQEQRGVEECIVCYDLATGAVRWLYSYPARYESVIAGIGPRATPTITGDRVHAFGATGILTALDRASGAPLWTRDVIAEHGAENLEWGASASPLVVGGLVIVCAGSAAISLFAYDAETGEPAWAGGADAAGYGSPGFALLAGVPQILTINAASAAGHDPATGDVLWSVPWSHANPNVAQPLALSEDRVLVSSGYGVGAALYRIVRRTGAGTLAAEPEWTSRALKAKFASFVPRDGFVYGLDDGILACIDVETGRRQWKGGRYGHGQVILVGDALIVSTEWGDVVLVEATPAAHRELARRAVLDGKTWNTPAFAAPYLLVRNDVEAVCLELPVAAALGTDGE